MEVVYIVWASYLWNEGPYLKGVYKDVRDANNLADALVADGGETCRILNEVDGCVTHTFGEEGCDTVYVCRHEVK